MTELPNDLVEVISARKIVNHYQRGFVQRYVTTDIACILLGSCPYERLSLADIEGHSSCNACFASRTRLRADETLSNLVAYVTTDGFREMWALLTGGAFVPTKPTRSRRDALIKKLLYTYQWCKEEDARLAANQNPEETE